MEPTKHAADQEPEVTSDETLLDELIFKQDLNEIHLLIDLVSGRPDRSLSGLSMPDPENAAKTMTSGEVMTAIAEIRYPPHGTKTVNARNAAILLVAKDRLSALAAPANGLTIAYTQLFIDAEADGSSWFATPQWLQRWLQKYNRAHDVRIDLAARTFPGLQAHARKFRRWRDALAFFSLFWLLLTGMAYWDAGLGRSALERLDQDVKTLMEELKDKPDLILCPDTTAAPDKTGADKLDSEAVRRQFECRKFNYQRRLGQTASTQVIEVFRCQGMGLSRLMHVWCWHWLLSGSALEPGARPTQGEAAQGEAAQREAAQRISHYVVYWPTATSILSVFTAYILPMMFALLGTLIGSFRAILNRIGAAQLSPRDLVRMKVGIPAGLVAGIAVGLFLSPSSAPVAGAGGVSGQLTLTASGLGFLAGYASHSFFGFLDNVIRSVFPDGSTANAATPPGTPPATGTRV